MSVQKLRCAPVTRLWHSIAAFGVVITQLVSPVKRVWSNAAAAIVWLRQDLRLADNPALHAACRRGGPVVPVFIWAPEEEGAWPPGGASRWWLHQSLAQLAAEFRAAGTELIIRRGASLAELQARGQGDGSRRGLLEPAL